MKDRIYEKQVIYMDSLRNLCIQKNWFTRGDCEEYDAFLNKVYEDGYDPKTLFRNHRNMTNDVLRELAEDIQRYSHFENEDEMSLPGIMFYLAQIRVSFFGYTDPDVKG